MRKDDDIRLRHMLDAAREAVAFAGGRTRADLDKDRQPARYHGEKPPDGI